MRFTMGPTAQAVTVLALVATLGGLVGVLGERVLAQRAAAAPTALAPPFRGPPGGPSGGGPRGGGVQLRYPDRLGTLLDLSAAQRAALDTIMAEQRTQVRELNQEMEPRFRAIAEQTRQRIEAVLTPEQVARFRTMRQQQMRGPPDSMMRRPGG